ncbi:class I SAM-dependent methyltransferase [Ensifer soli]|uniref:hypothetical protein n=1 Tax=Ciceribacter sp. sgz301302 TaxID=3342379 RepID=UPI0035B84871
MSVTEEQLGAALATGRFALIGAGQLGEMALALWPAGVEKPAFILDSRKRGTLGGIEIRDLTDHQPVEGITYLLSAFKMPTAEVDGIFARLGQPMVLTVYDFFDHHSPAIFSNGWRNLEADDATRARLAALPALFSDAESGAILEAVGAWRYDRVLRHDYPVGPEGSKYDLGLFGRADTHYDRVYDCGAFDLGLVDYFDPAGITFGRYLAFEPDPRNFATCERRKARLDDRRAAAITIDAHPVYDRPGSHAFLANGQLSARITGEGALGHPALMDLDAVTLDDVHAETGGAAGGRVLIKLHVEAAEPLALAGARRLIAATRSDILVNISHDERSLLEIPAVLAGFGAHDLYLRSHSLFGEGLTLFARHKD